MRYRRRRTWTSRAFSAFGIGLFAVWFKTYVAVALLKCYTSKLNGRMKGVISMAKQSKRNPVAKYAKHFNMAAVFRNRKKFDKKRQRQKDKSLKNQSHD